MLNLGLQEHLKCRDHLNASVDTASTSSRAASHVETALELRQAAARQPGDLALPGSDDFTMQNGALAVGSVVSPRVHASRKRSLFNLAWWKDAMSPQPSPADPGMPGHLTVGHVPLSTAAFPGRSTKTALEESEPNAHDFSEQLASLCADKLNEKLEARLGAGYFGAHPAAVSQAGDSWRHGHDAAVRHLVDLTQEATRVISSLQVVALPQCVCVCVSVCVRVYVCSSSSLASSLSSCLTYPPRTLSCSIFPARAERSPRHNGSRSFSAGACRRLGCSSD